MGYEICFKYFKKKSEGFGYDTEGEPEIMKVSVGKQWDDVDLNEVAKSVFGQMAKRNILIVDAEIFEYTKKKISFKMKDDGISIKNRKFSYDITGAIQSENEEPLQQNHIVLPSHPVIGQNGSTLEPHELVRRVQQEPLPEIQEEVQQNPISIIERTNVSLSPPGKPMRYEVYDPHPDLARIAIQKKLPFTIGKKYPIYEEKPDQRGVMFGMIYITEDDQGNRRGLNDKHFVPLQTLTNNFEPNTTPNHIARTALDNNQVAVSGKVMNLPNIYTLGNRR